MHQLATQRIDFVRPCAPSSSSFGSSKTGGFAEFVGSWTLWTCHFLGLDHFSGEQTVLVTC